MSIASALVLYAVIWFMCLFVALPQKIQSQEESGKTDKGTPASAPTNPMLKAKVRWTSIAAFLIWLPVCAVIASGILSIEDIDLFGRWGDGQYG